jgi:hypothetical protein
MAAGVNVTLIVQLPFTATEPGHVLVTAKSPGSAPPAPIFVIVKAALPVLVRVRDCAALVEPRVWAAKARVPVERFTLAPLPVPVRDAVCGLLPRLSAMLTEAWRIPVAVGENFTRIVQMAFCANVPGQLLVSEKSPGSAPTRVMPLIVKLVLPVFVIVMLCALLVAPRAWLAKVRIEGVRLTCPESPVPVRATDCGLPLALSAILTEAVRLPELEGVNVTLIVQLPFTVTTPPHVLVSAKSPALAPVTEMPVRTKVAVPVLVRVTL